MKVREITNSILSYYESYLILIFLNTVLNKEKNTLKSCFFLGGGFFFCWFVSLFVWFLCGFFFVAEIKCQTNIIEYCKYKSILLTENKEHRIFIRI